MLVISQRNAIIRDGENVYTLKRDVMDPNVPAWVLEQFLFKALLADGLISVSDSTSDKEVEKAVAAAEVKKTTKKAKKKE